MLTVLWALGSAVSYGLADFIGGVGGKRSGPHAVALVMQVSGAAAVAAYAATAGGHPRAVHLGWAALAGVCNGFGTAFLYRGLAHGRMGVVGPVSAVGAATLPVLVALALGERPSPVVWAGVAVGLPGIWLVSRSPGAAAEGQRSGFVDGVLAGLGFGGMFAALARVPEEAGLLPVAFNEVVAGLAIIAVAHVTRSRWVPDRPALLPGTGAGVLASAATVFFLWSTHRGLLTIAAILTSLYPAVTVLLAATVLHERIHRSQAIGLALCLGALVAVSAG